MALGELVGKFERYNSTELRRVNLPGGFPFAITGRIVSGGYGFVVIIVILASSFHLAPHRDDVQPLGGGATAFEATVATNSTTGDPSKSGTLNNEGDSVPFGVDAGEVEWDFASELRLVSVDVTVTWSAGTSSLDAGAPTVSLQVTAGNFSQTSDGTGFDASVTVIIPASVLFEKSTASGLADTKEEFIASFEAAGPAVSGVITYEDDANPSPIKDEPLDYTLTCSLVGWELQNIHEVSDL